MKLHEEFEQIPEIKNIILKSEAFYCEKGNWYLCPDESDRYEEYYLDGAWFMFQEMHKDEQLRKQD
jgi:hypothetical protein